MTVQCFELPKAAYRNFSLCPHCAFNGQQALLCRLCEGLPMISRSDGETFHLLLADRPLPYPLERTAGLSCKISVCFWYAHVRQPKCTFTTIVILAGSRTNHPGVFRKIEVIADLLAEELTRGGQLAEVYELVEDAAHPFAIS